jgi:hypothetical protein
MIIVCIGIITSLFNIVLSLNQSIWFFVFWLLLLLYIAIIRHFYLSIVVIPKLWLLLAIITYFSIPIIINIIISWH